MTIKSKSLFILIGDDKTGKTTLQKLLIEKLCGYTYLKLPVNQTYIITHPEIKRKYRNISFANRSYQEKIGDYVSIDNYFKNHFQPADIAFISSHLIESDISQMIEMGKRRFYNMYGVFFTNSIESNEAANSQISLLNWDERLIIENPNSDDDSIINNQLDKIAENIVIFIANRTSIS